MTLKVQGSGGHPAIKTHVVLAFVWEEGESRQQGVLTAVTRRTPNHQVSLGIVTGQLV